MTPIEGNQALPGVGDPTTCATKNTRRPLHQPLITTIATTAACSGSKYNSMQASLRQRAAHGLGPPARDISVPNTFGVIRNTISAPRVVELALKFYF